MKKIGFTLVLALYLAVTLKAQNLFVVNSGNNTIGEYGLDGSIVNVSVIPAALNTPETISFSSNDMFVVNGGGTIGVYTTSGATVNASLVSGLNGPPSGAISGTNLFVLNQDGTIVSEYTTSGATVNASLINGLDTDYGIAISGTNLFITSFYDGTVGEYTTAGATVNASLISGLVYPVGITIEGTNLFVANLLGGNVGEYTTSGATINASLISGLDQPQRIAILGTNLYVACEASGTVGEYTTSGATINASLITGLSNPLDVEISPPLSSNSVTQVDQPASPEDLFGHRLFITNNQSLYADFYLSQFTNLLTITNPTVYLSRSGFVQLTNLEDDYPGTNQFYFPAIPGNGSVNVTVSGIGQEYEGNVRQDVYATVFEDAAATNQPPQAQSSTSIFYTSGSFPPGGGSDTLGSGLMAPGFAPPPYLTNVVVTGPTLAPDNSNVLFAATALFSDGSYSTSTNMGNIWKTTIFSINTNGLLATGNVLTDTPAIISSAITYGTTATGTLATTIVKVQKASLLPVGTVTNARFNLKISGTTGQRYALESTTNLAGNYWTILSTNQIYSNSVTQVTDPGATNSKARYYRTLQLP